MRRKSEKFFGAGKRVKTFPANNIITKNHWAIGTVWTTDKGYKIEMHSDGFSCDCPAFRKCKHIKEVETKF